MFEFCLLVFSRYIFHILMAGRKRQPFIICVFFLRPIFGNARSVTKIFGERIERICWVDFWLRLERGLKAVQLHRDPETDTQSSFQGCRGFRQPSLVSFIAKICLLYNCSFWHIFKVSLLWVPFFVSITSMIHMGQHYQCARIYPFGNSFSSST